MAEKKLSTGTLVAYGVGDFYGGGSFLVIGLFFFFFLTEVAGLQPIFAGILIGLGEVWDGISDPLMGYISDRTKSRHGRRRVYFLAGIIPVFLTFAALWLPLNTGNQVLLFAYYGIANLLFNTVFTMVMVPYAAFNAELTTDFKDRTRLSAARMIFSQIGGLICGVVPGIILSGFADDPGTGHLVMGLVFGAFFALPFLATFFGTKSPEVVQVPENHGFGEIFRKFAEVRKNRSFLIHIGMYIVAYSAFDILMDQYRYFVDYYLGRPGLFTPGIGALIITQLIFMPIYASLANRFGKGKVYVTGLTIWAAAMASVLLLGRDASMLQVMATSAFIGMGQAAGVFIPWAILPSVIDVDVAITGERRAGTYAGAMTLVRKATRGLIAAPVVGIALQIIGFGNPEAGPPADLGNFKAFFVFAPLVLILLGILIGRRFPIDPRTHGLLKAEIERRQGGGTAEDATEEARAACELLTGKPYDSLFPG
jgi:oligogalacturonide transporter